MANITIPRPSKAAKPFMGSREEAKLVGAIRFIDGRQCNRKHDPTIRLTSNDQCVACRDISAAERKEYDKTPKFVGFLPNLVEAGLPVFQGSCAQAKAAGAKYYTNPRRPCRERHDPTIRLVSTTASVACQHEYHAANRDAILQHKHDMRVWNLEFFLEKERARYAANPEYFKQSAASWLARNREHKREKDAEWRIENAEQQKEYWAEWAKTHPDNVAAKAHKRRARKLGSTEHFTGDDVRLIREAQGNACAYCWVPLTAGMKANDHFIPLAGKDITGSNGPDNLILACTSCNARKSNRQPDVFIKADYPRLLRLRASHGEPTRIWPLLPILEIIDSFFPQPERTTP